MKTAASLLRQAAWLAPLALLVVVAGAAIQASNRGRLADALAATPPTTDSASAVIPLSSVPPPAATSLPDDPTPAATPEPPYPVPTAGSRFPPGYPVPPTIPPPEATAMAATSDAKATAEWATMIAEATRTTGTRIAEATPTSLLGLTGPLCVVDAEDAFSLVLPAGWYADRYSEGGAVLYNYDLGPMGGSGGPMPPGRLKITIHSGHLSPDEPFEQWLSERIASIRPAEGDPPLTVTQPEPFSLGKFEGISYSISSYMGDVQEIILPLEVGRVLVISLWPADASVKAEGLAIFSESLAVSPEEFCHPS